mgnify:CR=1 FL=1
MKQENGKRAMTAGLRRTMVIFVLDMLCIAGSFFLALWMRFEFRLGAIPQMYLNEYLKIIGPWIVICLVVFQLFRLYNSIWSFVSIDELFRIILAYGVLLAAGLAYVLILKIDMPRSFYFAGFIMSFMSTTALRFSYRFMRQLMAGISTEKSERDRILMIGAGEAGRQLIREIKESGDFCIGAACYPEGHPDADTLQHDVENLRIKQAAGAEHLLTQLFFDNMHFYRFLNLARRAGITLPVSAGVMPIVKRSQIERTVSLSSASLPSDFTRMISRYQDDPESLYAAGIDYAVRQLRDLIEGGADGIHLYAMNDAAIAAKVYDGIKDLL